MSIRRFSPENLRSLRLGAGLSRTDFGAACGVSFETVYNWETGKREPRANSLGHVSAVLDCPVDDLFVNDKGPTSEDASGLCEEALQTNTAALQGRSDEHAEA